MELIRHLGFVTDHRGNDFLVRVYGRERPDGIWEGWVAFFPLDHGRALATDREALEATRGDLVCWATRLREVDLMGAFARARNLRPHDSDSMIRVADVK